MSNNISLFPTLTEEHLNKIELRLRRFNFFYTDKEEMEHDLLDEQVEAQANLYCIKDENGIWSQDEYNIGFRRQYILKRYNCLFGKDGLVCKNAQIGLAILWTSSDSKQRGVIKITSFGYDETNPGNTINCWAEKLFPKGQLRGEVKFTTVLYVDKEGIPTSEESFLANKEGVLLGELDSYSLQLDGNGSMFPIYELEQPGQPLWNVKCDWIDPTTDMFSECISITLNTAHQNYKYIDNKQSCFNQQLLIEVLASALTVIIEKARGESGYWEQIINNDGLEQGSVGQAIYYFIETLGWDVSTPESVSLWARKFFDQRM